MSDERSHEDRLSPRNVALSDEAIDWIVLLGSGSTTDNDRTAFEAWRSRSPAHAVAAAEAASILEDIDSTRTAGEYRETGAAIRGSVPPHAPRHLSRRAVLAGGTVAFGVGLSAIGTFGPPSVLWSDYATGVGGRKRIALEDGSVVWLNTASALSVNYSTTERRVTLHTGEAFFKVARNAARPFIVASQGGEARAVGTAYTVRQRGALNDVVVTEGIVDVRSGSETVRLTAGEEVAYGNGIVGRQQAADSEVATAWTRGKLIFNHRPLGEVATELERYQHGKVIVRSERLKHLEVTGVFELDDTTTLLRAIAGTLNVPVTRLPLLTVIG